VPPHTSETPALDVSGEHLLDQAGGVALEFTTFGLMRLDDLE
jgi:hypothetical protein